MADGQFTYKQAGVDVEAGNRAVDLMKERLKSAQHPLVLGGLGGFGGAMRLPRLKDPVLVAGTDGVGTKIEVARAMGRLDTIGIDLVAMSVNDVSACGAVPLFFLDYLVTGKVVPEVVATIVAGVDAGCLQAQCVLLGGETAEHPGQFPDGDFDLAGFAVGLAERDELWGPQLVQDGDVLVGIGSSGLHSNGFSLVRHLLKEHQIDLDEPFADRLAAPHGRTLRRMRPLRWAMCSSRPPRSTARRCTTWGMPAACTPPLTSRAAASPTTSGAPCRAHRPRRSTWAPGRRRRCIAGCTRSASARPRC